MELPEWMIHQSFRYALGRMTYAVSNWCDWAVDNWDKIPDGQKNIIIRELDEAFVKDDKERNNPDIEFKCKWLGHNCDRQQWERVRELYSK